ncbi:MAG TPA: hypothetical protein PKH15_01005, partial [Bacteroidales bacterium]|nr:hypothetical protein [Bacteroidales bacterium]
MSLKHPLNPDLNHFYIALIPQGIQVDTPWGFTIENYHGAGDYQTQYIDFKVYGAELMIGDMYVYEIMNNKMIMTNQSNPSSEAIIEIMSLKHPLNPDLNHFYIALYDDPQGLGENFLEVGTPWGVTIEDYHGEGDYQTQYIDFKVYGAELMIGDMYVYEIMNNN